MNKKLEKPKREANLSRLKWVKTQPCIAEGKVRDGGFLHECYGPRDAHHVYEDGDAGVKPSDFRTVCACRKAHNIYHSIGKRAFELQYGVDLEAEILRLNGLYRPPKVRKQRERKPTVRAEIKGCPCGRPVHKIAISKILMTKTAVVFRCPLSSKEVRAER